MDEEQKNVIEDNGEPEKTIGCPETEESETIPVHPIAQTIDTTPSVYVIFEQMRLS